MCAWETRSPEHCRLLFARVKGTDARTQRQALQSGCQTNSRGAAATRNLSYGFGHGDEQKRVTLSTDFRSPPENGHSRYGRLIGSKKKTALHMLERNISAVLAQASKAV
jgi:hypothetical protein